MDSQSGDAPATSGAGETGRERIRAWVLGHPLAATEGTDDYRRYDELLPQVLAGTLPPGSADVEWFEGYLDECAPCLTEYDELQVALDADRASRLAGTSASTGLAGQDYDLSFLPGGSGDRAGPPVSALERAQAAWRARVQPTVRLESTAGGSWVTVSFTGLPESRPPLRPAAGPGDVSPTPGEEKVLFTRTIPADAAVGLPGSYLLRIGAVPVDATTCRLRINLQLPGRADAGQRAVVVRGATSGELTTITNARGAAYLSVPIEDLPGLSIRIELGGGEAMGPA